MGCQNATKNAENLFANTLQKFWKFTVSSISHYLDGEKGSAPEVFFMEHFGMGVLQ